MHSQIRFEGSLVPAVISGGDAGSPGLDAHGWNRRNETFWTDLPDDEFEAVS